MASRHSDDWIERSCRPSELHAPIDAMARGDVAVDQIDGIFGRIPVFEKNPQQVLQLPVRIPDDYNLII